MDYSTLKNIKSPQEINNIDAIDLSDNYVNDNNEHNFEKKNSSTINNNSLCPISDGNGNDNNLSDRNHVQLLGDLTQETKLKLNFSVDRILGHNESNRLSAGDETIASRTPYCDNKFNDKLALNSSNCNDCDGIGGVQNCDINSALISHPAEHQQIFSVPFTMATMLNLSKSVVRPMPVRYLTRSPTGI